MRDGSLSYLLADGTVVDVRVPDAESLDESMHVPRDFSVITDTIVRLASEFHRVVERIEVAEATVQFSLQLSAKQGIPFLAEAAEQGTIQVSLKLAPRAPQSTDPAIADHTFVVPTS